MSAINAIDPANRDETSSPNQWTDVLCPLALVIIGWGIILFAFSTHQNALIDHDYLLRASHLPWLLALGLFLASWQIMTIAMMLPSTLLALSAIVYVSRRPRHLWTAQAIFIAGYASVWTAFALVAFLGDTLIHRMVTSWFWLYTHSWLIGAVTLAVAGVFQFSPFKKRCLQHCRNPVNLCTPFSEQGIGSSWHLGLRYGSLCLGSCWAIMLIMFGIGIRSPLWMAALTGVMLLEKGVPGGQRLRSVIGVVFFLLAILRPVFSV